MNARGAVAGRVECDGRNDLVPFTGDAPELRLAEDVFVDVAGRPLRAGRDGLRGLVDSAVASLHGEIGARSSRRRLGVRVVARVQSERAFRRTDLRDALTARITDTWRHCVEADPGDVQVWMLETESGRFRLGVRRSDASMRQHGGRSHERGGALRPVVAAAMVSLAGEPPAAGGRLLLDPCCGSGTLLVEGRAAGWGVAGADIDAGAVAATMANAPGAPVLRVDARRLPFADDAFDAVVSNLPFGGQYAVQGSPIAWFRKVLAEAHRVAPVAVVLAPQSPPFRQALGRLPWRLDERHDLTLLGFRTTLWRLSRSR